MALARDGCVVATEPLADLLSGFCARWRAHRPPTAGQFAPRQQRTEVPFVGPVEYIASETARAAARTNPPGRGVSPGTIERIIGRRSALTELRTADALVAAIDCPEAWHDGTLEIRPNPSASSSQRAACCGGSLTGGALGDLFWSQLAQQ